MLETLVTLPEDLRAAEDGADLAIINAHADELNAEAEDALTYQALAWALSSPRQSTPPSGHPLG